MSNKTAPALRLTLGGAPNMPQQIPGVPGLYRPDRPTPVDGPGEVSLDEARQLDKDPGVPLELERVPADDLDELRAAYALDLAAYSRQNLQPEPHTSEINDADLPDASAPAPEEG